MGIDSELKQQAAAVLVMMGLSIIAVLGIVILNVFTGTVQDLPGLGNGTGSGNATAQTTLGLYITALALFGSFASITALVILVKGIIGVVRRLQ